MAFGSEYQAKPGSRVSNVAVRVFGAAIEALNESGCATPEALVEMARDPSSPLHPYFEWDDAKAANQYRIDQARYYLRSITVEYTTEDGVTLHLRAFNPQYTELGRSWVPVTQAFERDGELKILLERAKDELRAFRKKYAALRLSEADFMHKVDSFIDDD